MSKEDAEGDARAAPSDGFSRRGDGAAGAAALRLFGVTRDYGGVRAVDDVTFDVPSGGRCAVIGPNGAGKTTLFKLISREEPLSSGRIEFLGVDISRTPAHRVARSGLGRTYQITRVFPQLSVLENIYLSAQGVSAGKFSMLRPVSMKGEVAEKARDAMDRVGLKDVAHVKAAELGHGRQRQLELGLALAAQPRVLLLDEPAAGLSAAERGLMRELVADLPEEITLLLIEHDMELALGLADDVVCLHNGKTVAKGSPEEIKNDERVQDIYLGRT